MKQTLFSLNIFISLIFLFSCSTNTDSENELVKKQHSEETNRAFSMIENYGSYRRKVEPNSNKILPPIEVVGEPVTPTQKPKKVKQKGSLPESVMIEINQNLAYYCMQHRKSRRFGGSEEKCMTYVNKTLGYCQQKSASSHHKLLKCLKTELKKRS